MECDGEFLEKLWACYRKGVEKECLPEKELFIALIADLIKQIKHQEE